MLNVGVVACRWKHGVSDNLSLGKNLPVMLRRRLTMFAQNVTGMLYESLELIRQEEEDIQWVASCRHGDQSRTVELLSNIANKELILPTNFSFSVHNAIIGMFSIAIKNKCSYTALSGGNESFVSGLLEAMALQAESNSKVGYIYFDGAFNRYYEDIIAEKAVDICIIILLDNETKNKKINGVNLCYKKDELTSISNDYNNILALIDFFNKDEKLCRISAPGGQLCLERNN
jgi:hypothetical protein